MSRYKAYKESGIHWLREIPEHWQVTRIKDIFIERSEKGHPDEPVLCSTQKYGVIPQNMYENRVVAVNKGLEGLKLVRQGDFVISLRSFQGGIEYAYFQGIISAAYTVLQLQKRQNEDYFKYLVKSFGFIQLLQTCTTGIREGRNINYGVLRANCIFMPPYEEQRAIAEYLDREVSRIDRIVELLTAQQERYDQLKRSLITEVITKGLPHHNPSVWMYQRIKDVASITTGNTPSKNNDGYYGGNVPFYKPSDMIDDVIYYSQDTLTNLGASMGRKAPIGATLICCIGSLGKASYLGNTGCFNQQINAVAPYKCINSVFLFYYLISEHFQNILKSCATLTTLPIVNANRFSLLPISLPSLNEQEEIVAYLDERCGRMERISEAIGRKIELLEALRKSLIEEVVTGKRSVIN